MLSDSQRLSLLELYSVEICKRLHYLNQEKASDLLQLVDVRTVERLREEFPDHFGEKFWDELRTSPLQEQRKGLFDSLQAYFHDVGDDLHGILSEVYTRNKFNVVLEHLSQFLEFLEFDKCVEQLKTQEHYKEVVKTILSVCDDSTEPVFKKKLLLRTIPCLSSTSVYDLMATIYDSSPEATKFIESIHPNFMRYYHHLLESERKNPHGLVTLWPKGCDLSFFLCSSVDPSVSTEAVSVDMNYEDLPDAPGVKRRLLTCINNKMFKETPLNLRDYQKELCEAADGGLNCIIAAPTGSGKTIVAASIIRNHLNAGPAKGRKADPKVLFLVNSTAIISQQADCMAKFLDHKFTVDRISGMDQKPFKEVVNSHDVVVCTPQLVVNQLVSDATADFDFTPTSFRLDEFSLIVFDECHNTRKGSPYSVLMQHYHLKKFTGVYKHGPQIVGLTASLGVGSGTKTADDALRHISRLCALLDCPVVSIVRRHTAQLQEFSPPTADELHFSQVSEAEPERMAYILLIHRTMAKVEQKIRDLYRQAHVQVAKAESETDLESLPERSAGAYTVITDPPHDKGCFEYLAWVATHIRRLIPESSMKEDVKKRVTELFEILEIFYRSLELCDDFTTEKSLDHLVEEFGKKRRFLAPEINTILQEVLQQLRPNTTKKCVLVEAAESLLLDQHKISGNFRAIVFVRTRKGTMILSSLLNECTVLQEAGINSEPLFGMNAPEGGNKREQEEKLDRFKKGETRVLVSTSVADEGLDIAQCSLVIKYNYTTNEIAHVQRRGRGRAKGSRCVLVTNSPLLRKQEEGNIMKEKLMEQAMEAVEKNRCNLAAMVEREIKLLREEILKGETNKKETVQAQKARGIEYEIKCKRCDVLLCMDSHVKTHVQTQYCVCDPDFWKKTITFAMDEKQCTESKFGEVGKLMCKGNSNGGCGGALGCIVRIKSNCMPVLAAEAIVIVNQKTGEKRAFKKWKKVTESCFTPEAVRAFDVAEMQKASTFKLEFTGVP